MVNLLRLAALAIAAALGACAELSADAPLFSPADQAGPPPLTEGVWIAVGEKCPAANARRRTGRFPADCSPLEVRQAQDGAWRVSLRIDLVYGLSAQERAEAEEEDAGPYRLVIAPAVERTLGDSYAPIYVAETTREEATGIAYVVIAPLGQMPATSALVVLSVSCADILRDGPIDGVAAQYTANETTADASEAPESEPAREPTLSGCIASTQAGVREAARRAVIENLDEMLERRFVYVRPN